MFTIERNAMISLLDEMMRHKIVGAYEFDDNNRELFIRGFVENDEHETWGIDIVFDANGEVIS